MHPILELMVPYKPMLTVITYRPGLDKQDLLSRVPVLNCTTTSNVTFETLRAMEIFHRLLTIKVNLLKKVNLYPMKKKAQV